MAWEVSVATVMRKRQDSATYCRARMEDIMERLSPQEDAMVGALKASGERGCTTADLYERAGTLRASARVWDLKRKGIVISVTPEGMVGGTMRYRYRLVGQAHGQLVDDNARKEDRLPDRAEAAVGPRGPSIPESSKRGANTEVPGAAITLNPVGTNPTPCAGQTDMFANTPHGLMAATTGAR